ncbi:MAG: hypothetical protein E6J62_17900 [Deltaproteobacteria bacterium]|nr:MAG: hypothetical protein E6J62_17900 [Deltaproteobacteria bacterium]
MSAVARWSFPIASIAVACLGALVMPACGSSPDLVDRSAAAASTAVPAARAPDAPGDAAKDDAGDEAKIQIKTISNRADLISGGDALVEIALSKAKLASSLRVQLNGRDVSSAFAVRGNGRILGLVSGLVNGNNVLVASTSKSHAASLAITNHPIGGPVIAGPQTAPFVCATPTAQPATATLAASNASGLSTSAVDVQCNIATETFLFYRTTAACTGVLPDPSPVTATSPTAAGSCFKRFTPGQTPADLAFTTTDQGVTVPYIVRVERGTIDRGIFDIAVLFTPGEAWTPFAPQRQWNRKVVHTFGASTGQPRRQFRTEQNWADDAALSRGFMVVDNSMTDSLFDANRVYNAEVVMMMKEHIIETYGEIRYTMGNGCSGGSIQQVTAASIFPGLLDGIQPTCTYPDSETTGMEVTDCVLLVNFFNSAAFANSNVGLTQAQINAKKTAIAGHLDQTACWGWNNTFGSNGKPGNFVPSLVINGVTGAMANIGAPRNNCQLLANQVYDPLTNLTGPRCGPADNAISIFGPAAGTTNRGRSTGDNVGITYGLKALVSGAISPEEFVTLNEAGQLGKTPIIDIRGFDEVTPDLGAGRVGLFGIHQIWRSFALRARLDNANGTHGNHVLWRFPTNLLAPAGFTLRSFLTMDEWLANIEKDKSNVSRAQKVLNDKPADAFDFCVLSTDPGLADPAVANKVTDFGVCDTDPRLVRHHPPRQVAGGPDAENILKCQLKPLDFGDPAFGGVTFSADQQARLRSAFPNGVCDWSKPGVNQAPFIGPLTFQDGPGGKILGPAPQSGRCDFAKNGRCVPHDEDDDD